MRSALLVPLLGKGRIIGGLAGLGKRGGGSFQERDLSLLTLFANQVSTAIENARLFGELQQLVRQLEDRVETRTAELRGANRELESFSYSVSHDLRAPLISIEGFSAILLEDHADRLDEQGRGYLQRIRAATRRMTDLIDGLLKLSRSSRGELEVGPVDLSALARRVAEQIQAQDPDRPVTWVVAEGLSVRGDARLLESVLQNLLGNAWKYTGRHPRARVEVGRAKGDAGNEVLFVRDDGAGFDMASAPRLFGLFQRLHPDSQFPGTGIGLATVQRIIHRHGGRIWAEGAIEAGATFYFSLPTHGGSARALLSTVPEVCAVDSTEGEA
jgi:light-regulated signal transduction histidine kinase (bacteriophytochrome)